MSGRDQRVRPRQGIRADSLLGVVPTIVLVAALCIVLLGGVAGLVTLSDYPFKYFSRDPASTFETSPFVGLLSHVGVLLVWGAAAASVFAGAFVARARGLRQASPLIAAGLGAGYLALDDLFLFHEDIYPRKIGIAQEAVLVTYVVVALAFLWWYRNMFYENEWPLLATAGVVLAAAFLLDFVTGDIVGVDRKRWFEDGLKLFGLAFLASYLVRLGARMLADAYPLAGGEVAEGGGATAEGTTARGVTDPGPVHEA